jgi:hypothetical protein
LERRIKKLYLCPPATNRTGFRLQKQSFFEVWMARKRVVTFAARFNRKRATQAGETERRKTFFAEVLGKSEMLVTFAPRLNEAAPQGSEARKKRKDFSCT